MLVTIHLSPGIRQSLCEYQGPLVERVVVVQMVHVLVVPEFFIWFSRKKTWLLVFNIEISVQKTL